MPSALSPPLHTSAERPMLWALSAKAINSNQQTKSSSPECLSLQQGYAEVRWVNQSCALWILQNKSHSNQCLIQTTGHVKPAVYLMMLPFLNFTFTNLKLFSWVYYCLETAQLLFSYFSRVILNNYWYIIIVVHSIPTFTYSSLVYSSFKTDLYGYRFKQIIKFYRDLQYMFLT